MTSLARTVEIYGREARAQIVSSFRTPQFLIPSVALPVMFYALFGVALARNQPPHMAQWLLATYAVFAAIGPSIFGFGVHVATERETGVIALKRVSPMPQGAYVAAKLAASASASVLALAGIAIVAASAGVTMPAWRWAAVLALGAASTAPFALIGMNLGLRLGSQGATAAANLLFFSFSVLGGLWIPLTIMPGWMTTLAWALPSYHLGQLSLMLAGMTPARDVVAHVALVLCVLVVAAAGAWRGWRRQGA
jgi:ABC-2 type transport system permease protein